MDADLNATLYVHHDGEYINPNVLARDIAAAISGSTKLNVAYDEFSIFNVKINKDYDPISIDDANFTGSKFLVESAPNKSSPLPVSEIYIEILVHVIKELRAKGYLVVIVGDFEELVVRETGWNWTESTPHQP